MTTVSDFQFIEDLHLIRYRGDSGKLFFLEQPYRVFFRLDSVPEIYTVPAGTWTDFASIPRGVQNIVQVLGPHIEAAVVHDRLCQDRKPWSSRVAADIFLAGMTAAEVPLIRRNLMYRAVVMFGPQWD